jgi:hypothetical protein
MVGFYIDFFGFFGIRRGAVGAENPNDIRRLDNGNSTRTVAFRLSIWGESP